jgi:hypothetical protein
VIGSMISLGYSARISSEESARHWSRERRESFLFKLDVPSPLSVDNLVWPSVFKHDAWPPVDFANEELWSDLAALKASAIAIDPNHAGESNLIGVSVVAADEEERDYWEIFVSANLKPPDDQVKTVFLGYDVAHRSMLSGLSNCGLDPNREDVEALRRRWGPVLNDHHLFDSLVEAGQFRLLSNQRVKEHAPFSIFGITRYLPEFHGRLIFD